MQIQVMLLNNLVQESFLEQPTSILSPGLMCLAEIHTGLRYLCHTTYNATDTEWHAYARICSLLACGLVRTYADSGCAVTLGVVKATVACAVC
jgi:hypothetical protein